MTVQSRVGPLDIKGIVSAEEMRSSVIKPQVHTSFCSSSTYCSVRHSVQCAKTRVRCVDNFCVVRFLHAGTVWETTLAND